MQRQSAGMEAEDAVLSAGTTVEWVFGADDVEKVQGFAGFEFNADAQPYQSVMKTANKKLVSVPILNWEIRSGDLDESRGSFRKVAVALRHEEGGCLLYTSHWKVMSWICGLSVPGYWKVMLETLTIAFCLVLTPSK